MEKSSSSSSTAAVAKLASLLIISVLVISFPKCDAITCGEVIADLHSCVPYIRIGGTAAPECCKGVKTVAKEASTKADRQMVCTCLKSVASSYNDDQFHRAAGLPKLCGVSLSFNITRNIDCSKVPL